MLKIWGRINSINVMKVLWACDELGLRYERTDAGMAHGVVNSLEYKAMNPNSRVPTIDDNGFILWESNTIVRYLATQNPTSALISHAIQGRADAERWMDWCTSALQPPMTPLFWQLVRTPTEKREPATIKAAHEDTVKMFEIANAHLAGRKFMLGDKLSVADIPLGCFTHRYMALPVEHPKMPHLEAWYARLKERPGYVKHVALALS